MLASLTALIADVRSLINESVANFWSDTEITRWLNEGQEIFAAKTKCLPSFYSRTLTAADIVRDREVHLYHDFIAFDEGGVLYNGVPLAPTTLKALDEWVGKWRDTTGTPIRFYIRGDHIGFYPKPSSGDTVSYYGIERAPDLSTDEVPLTNDYRVIPYRRHIRDYAVAKCWEKKNEWAKRNVLMTEFEAGIYNARAELMGDKLQGYKMIPSYTPRGTSAYAIRHGRTDVFD